MINKQNVPPIDMPLFLINNTDGFIKIYLNIEVIEMK